MTYTVRKHTGPQGAFFVAVVRRDNKVVKQFPTMFSEHGAHKVAQLFMRGVK